MFPVSVLTPLTMHSYSNWFNGSSSAVCPTCLREGSGWWLEWRFAWTMLCTHHETFLVNTCTGCEQLVRMRSPLPHQNVCDNRIQRQACGQPLDLLAPGPAVDHDGLFAIQERLTRATYALATRQDVNAATDELHQFLTDTRNTAIADDLPGPLHEATTAWFANRKAGQKFSPPPMVTAGLALSADR